MAERYRYVHEGPVHFDEICNVTGQEWEDVWGDLIEGCEESFHMYVQEDDDRRFYERRPLPDLSAEQEDEVRKRRLFQQLLEFVNNKEGLSK